MELNEIQDGDGVVSCGDRQVTAGVRCEEKNGVCSVETWVELFRR